MVSRVENRRLFRVFYPLSVLLLVCALAAGAIPRAAAHTAHEQEVSLSLMIARMTPRERIAQLFMVGVNGADLAREVGDWHVGGLILYSGDIVSRVQVRAMLVRAQRESTIPLLISTDQEGGEVDQLLPSIVPSQPAPAIDGRVASAADVYRDARATGRAMRLLGLNMNLVPVIDVLTNPASPIGSRSYGADPTTVARLGVAAIHGYQDEGVAATAKHFLGLGGVAIDAHQGFPTVARDRGQLMASDLIPMRAAIAAGTDALMVTNVALPALDPTGTPASLSRPIVRRFIRGVLGYRGLIITDSLAMAGLSRYVHDSIPAAAVQAVAAGDDMALISADASTIRASLDLVERAVAAHKISMTSINRAVRHILILKRKLGLLPGVRGV